MVKRTIVKEFVYTQLCKKRANTYVYSYKSNQLRMCSSTQTHFKLYVNIVGRFYLTCDCILSRVDC